MVRVFDGWGWSVAPPKKRVYTQTRVHKIVLCHGFCVSRSSIGDEKIHSIVKNKPRWAVRGNERNHIEKITL